MSSDPASPLAERLLEAAGGDAGAAAAEVAAFLVERASLLDDDEATSTSSPSPPPSSLPRLLDEVSSFLSAGGAEASVLDAGVFDWAPRLLGVGGGGRDVFDGSDRHRDEQSSPSSLFLAVRRLASTLATHLSAREALALFSAELTSSTAYREGGGGEERPRRPRPSWTPKQAAVLSAMPSALSRLPHRRTGGGSGGSVRLRTAERALEAATGALRLALTDAASASAAAKENKEQAEDEVDEGAAAALSSRCFLAACEGATELCSSLPGVFRSWYESNEGDDEGKERAEEIEEEKRRARSLLASAALRLLPAACLPAMPLSPSPSSPSSSPEKEEQEEAALLGRFLRPQTVAALTRGARSALGSSSASPSSPVLRKKEASAAATRVAVAAVSALCSLRAGAASDSSVVARDDVSYFRKNWGFEASEEPPPKEQKGDDGGSDDDDDEEEEEAEEREAAPIGKPPSPLSLALVTYASAWCSLGVESRREEQSAAASSRSLEAAAFAVPSLVDAAFRRRSPGVVVAAAQLASVAAAFASSPSDPRASANDEGADENSPPRSSRETLLSALSRAMTLTPSSSARNACYEAWDATLASIDRPEERARECVRIADDAATGRADEEGESGVDVASSPSPSAPNPALEALALHHLTSLVASLWPRRRQRPGTLSEADDEGEGGDGSVDDGFVAAASALAEAATDRLFPLRRSSSSSSSSAPVAWGGSEVSLLERGVEPVAASVAALRLLLGRAKSSPLVSSPSPSSPSSPLPEPLARLSSREERHRRWRRKTLVADALLPLRAAASSAAAGMRAAAGPAARECHGGGSEAGMAAERLLDALARVLELAEE